MPILRELFAFMAKAMYFLATNMVFGSNVSASSWESFRRAIAVLIIKYLMISNLVFKHKLLLDMLKWEDEDKYIGNFSKKLPAL
jgi:hypothetical protein